MLLYKSNKPTTRITFKWEFMAPQTYLWLIIRQLAEPASIRRGGW